MTFTAIVTCNSRARELRYLLGCLMYQSRKPDETLVYVSDLEPHVVAELREDFPHATFTICPNLEDWGHAKRAQGIVEATGDVLGFFNDDDSYDATYIAQLLAKIEAGADVAYCNWSSFPETCRFAANNSTAGNFLVRTEIARQVGWNGRDYCADGEFIDGVAAVAKRVVRVNKLLYNHNLG